VAEETHATGRFLLIGVPGTCHPSSFVRRLIAFGGHCGCPLPGGEKGLVQGKADLCLGWKHVGHADEIGDPGPLQLPQQGLVHPGKKQSPTLPLKTLRITLQNADDGAAEIIDVTQDEDDGRPFGVVRRRKLPLQFLGRGEEQRATHPQCRHLAGA